VGKGLIGIIHKGQKINGPKKIGAKKEISPKKGAFSGKETLCWGGTFFFVRKKHLTSRELG